MATKMQEDRAQTGNEGDAGGLKDGPSGGGGAVEIWVKLRGSPGKPITYPLPPHSPHLTCGSWLVGATFNIAATDSMHTLSALVLWVLACCLESLFSYIKSYFPFDFHDGAGDMLLVASRATQVLFLQDKY